MRILRSFHSIKLGNLSNSRIKIERINSIKLKSNLTITLIISFLRLIRNELNNIYVYYVLVICII